MADKRNALLQLADEIATWDDVNEDAEEQGLMLTAPERALIEAARILSRRARKTKPDER